MMSDSATKMPKRKSYSMKYKLAIIARVKNGESPASIKKLYGIPQGTVRGWVDEEKKLLSFMTQLTDKEAVGRKRTRAAKHMQMDEELYAWYQKRLMEGPVSITAIKQQAKILCSTLKVDEQFKVSSGWFRRWQKRYGVTQETILETSRPCVYEGASVFLHKVEMQIRKHNYKEEQIYACGGNTLCYKMLPNKGISVKIPNKLQSTDRAQTLFCVNMSGSHRLKPLLVGKSLMPRCFKDVNMDLVPVIYMGTPDATLTSEVLHLWFVHHFVPSVTNYLLSVGMEPKALLLIDNFCEGEPLGKEILRSDDGEIRAVFVPRNTTSASISQLPLEQGIIQSVKVNYKQRLITEMEISDKDPIDFLKSLTLMDVAYKISDAWENVEVETIIKCWKNCLGSLYSYHEANNKTGDEDSCQQENYDWIKVEPETYEDNSIDYESEDEKNSFESFDEEMLYAKDEVKFMADKNSIPSKPEVAIRDITMCTAKHIETPTLSTVLESADIILKWLQAQDHVDTQQLQCVKSVKQCILNKLKDN